MPEDAAGLLVMDGALGCEVGKIKSGLRSKKNGTSPVVLRAYFDRITPQKLKRLQAKLKKAGMLAAGAIAEHQQIKDPGWATMWQERFTPLRIGGRFLIVPPWQLENEPDRISLIIEPGQAFGTGHHSSTSGTLIALEQLCRNRAVTHGLDVGTGSGILAIAMAKLGVANVIAIDTDEAVLANAKENAELNRVVEKIHFSTTPLNDIPGRFALIAANILSSTLIRMAPDLIARLRSHGHLVLAGILRHEAQSVADTYAKRRLACVGWNDYGAWTTLVLKR